MTKDDVPIRLRELFGIEGRPVQVDTVHEVSCRGRSMILTAKTAIGKSAIFEVIPLLDPSNPGIALVVMPLKHIQQQQLEKINNIPGGDDK